MRVRPPTWHSWSGREDVCEYKREEDLAKHIQCVGVGQHLQHGVHDRGVGRSEKVGLKTLYMR